MRTAGLPLIALCAALAPGTALAWPTVPLPEGSKGEMVSEQMNYNGLEMRASKFTTRLAIDDVVAFYAKTWGEGDHVVTPLGNGKVVGHAERGYFVSVELKPSGAGTTGTIGIVRDPGKGKPPALGRDFYRPAGTEVVSDITHDDTPQKTRTIALRNRLSPYANLQLYDSRLQGDGWRGTITGKCLPASTDCVVSYQRADGGRMAMTLSRDEKKHTTVVVNIE